MNVTVENAVKSFGDVRALNGVSLDMPSGELFFLLGPSGCGKTTLLRAIAGLESIDSGRILFDGEDVAEEGVCEGQAAGCEDAQGDVLVELVLGRGAGMVGLDRRLDGIPEQLAHVGLGRGAVEEETRERVGLVGDVGVDESEA